MTKISRALARMLSLFLEESSFLRIDIIADCRFLLFSADVMIILRVTFLPLVVIIVVVGNHFCASVMSIEDFLGSLSKPDTISTDRRRVINRSIKESNEDSSRASVLVRFIVPL